MYLRLYLHFRSEAQDAKLGSIMSFNDLGWDPFAGRRSTEGQDGLVSVEPGVDRLLVSKTADKHLVVWSGSVMTPWSDRMGHGFEVSRPPQEPRVNMLHRGVKVASLLLFLPSRCLVISHALIGCGASLFCSPLLLCWLALYAQIQSVPPPAGRRSRLGHDTQLFAFSATKTNDWDKLKQSITQG